MTSGTEQEEFKQLRCEKCGKTFEIPVEETKSRNYSKRCDTCQVSTTRLFDEPGRKKTEVCGWPGRIGKKDRAAYPEPRDEKFESFELFDGEAIDVPEGLPNATKEALRVAAAVAVTRVTERLIDPVEVIRSVVARLVSGKQLKDIVKILDERRTYSLCCAVDAIVEGCKDSARRIDAQTNAIPSLLRKLAECGKISDDEAKCFVEVRLKGRSLREASVESGIPKTSVSRNVDAVVLAIREHGVTKEMSLLMDDFHGELNQSGNPVIGDDGVYQVEGLEQDPSSYELRDVKDKFSVVLNKGPERMFDLGRAKGEDKQNRMDRKQLSTVPLYDDYSEDSGA